MIAGNRSGYQNAKQVDLGGKGGKDGVARQGCLSPHYNLRQFFRLAGDQNFGDIIRGIGNQYQH